jgi:hypothetical protein
VALGPFALSLRASDGSVRALTTAATTIDVTAPWPGDEPPPFGAWRRPASRSDRSWWVGLAASALALVAAGAWLVRRRSRPVAPAPPRARVGAPPTVAQWRALLLGPIGEGVGERRSWCIAVHALLRRELAVRARAADFAWSREELVANAGFGAWSASGAERWTQLLHELERGMFARESTREPASRIGAPLLDLLDRSAQLDPSRSGGA